MTEILSKIRDLIGVAKLDELSQTNPELALRNKRIDIFFTLLPFPHVFFLQN